MDEARQRDSPRKAGDRVLGIQTFQKMRRLRRGVSRLPDRRWRKYGHALWEHLTDREARRADAPSKSQEEWRLQHRGKRKAERPAQGGATCRGEPNG